MTKENQSFQFSYSRHTWCLVECNKLIRSVDGRGENPWSGNFNSCFVMSFCLSNLPTLLFTYLKQIVMLEQKDNIVRDSYNNVTWDMSGFFQVLEMYYEGKPELMAEDLVQAAKVMLILKDSVIDEELKDNAVHLLYLRDAVKEINVNQTL